MLCSSITKWFAVANAIAPPDPPSPMMTLMIGTRDKTALGTDLVEDGLAAELGNYPKLADEAVARMPNADLITFEGIGHLPPIEAPKRFKNALFKTLDTPSSESDD